MPHRGESENAPDVGGEWKISTDHFDPYAASLAGLRRGPKRPLTEILIEGSTYSRSNLKQRLYEEGLKTPVCELCEQGEIWRGKRMGLILDHINGVRNDNRIENLRVVSQLRGNLRHPLRAQTAQYAQVEKLCQMRQAFPAEVSRPPLLLACLRLALGPRRETAAGGAEGSAAAA